MKQPRQLRIQREARGFTGVFGRDIDKLFKEAREQLQINERLFWPPHITLMKYSEAKTLSASAAHRRFPDAVMRDITPIGIGGYPKRGIYYLVVLCPAAQRHRRALGLPLKDFHITLSPDDDQDLVKGPDTLLNPLDWEATPPRVLCSFVQHLTIAKSPKALYYGQLLCRSHATWPPFWVALAEAFLNHQSHDQARMLESVSTLTYARACMKTAHLRTVKEIRRLLRKLHLKPQDDVQNRLLAAAKEAEFLQPQIRSELCKPWSSSLVALLCK